MELFSSVLTALCAKYRIQKRHNSKRFESVLAAEEVNKCDAEIDFDVLISSRTTQLWNTG